MNFTHEVPAEVREQSHQDWDYACMVTPDGRCWRYTDDPSKMGVSWQDDDGRPIAVARWLRDARGRVISAR